MMIISNDHNDNTTKLKQHLFRHFQTIDIDKLKYFLGIAIAQFKFGIVIS